MARTESTGAVLIISAKPRVQSALRSALATRYGRVLTAESIIEAKRFIERDKIVLALLLTPLKDEEEIHRFMDTADRRMIALVYVVSREAYAEEVYRTNGRSIFVLAYPLQLEQVMQAVSFLYQAQQRFFILLKEQERLRAQLKETQMLSRAKCLLIEKKGMTEEEAHYYVLRKAMDESASKGETAARILKELQDPAEETNGQLQE